MKAQRRAPRLPLAGRSSELGYWLQRGADRFARVLRTRLAAAGITHAECAALRELYRLGRTSPTLLVRELGMTKGAVSKVTDQLREKGLLARWIVEEDQRQLRTVLEAVCQEP